MFFPAHVAHSTADRTNALVFEDQACLALLRHGGPDAVRRNTGKALIDLIAPVPHQKDLVAPSFLLGHLEFDIGHKLIHVVNADLCVVDRLNKSMMTRDQLGHDLDG